MVGHCDRRHAQPFHTLAKLFDVAGAIEQGVIGMQVQVDELGHRRRTNWRLLIAD
jgi:hypothetical protein